KLKEQNSEVKEIRGAGLMVGIELDSPVKPVIAKCLENGLLLVGAGEKVIRMLPPLTVSEKEIESAVDILASALVVHSDV
ncbi:aminotransferase class III-fold pyridoxal phosphate-dependent enzyme, partial [Acinetobacter baumannii]